MSDSEGIGWGLFFGAVGLFLLAVMASGVAIGVGTVETEIRNYGCEAVVKTRGIK